MKRIILAQKGRSDYKVIISKNASATVRFAAREFVEIFEKISGVALRLREDTQPRCNNEIVIGDTNRPWRGPEMKTVGEDGYALFACAGQLYIRGANDRGVLYGVYSFLEEELGCRWFTETLERIPRRDTVTIGEINRAFTPSFFFRRGSFIDNDQWQFSVRNKINGKKLPDSICEHGYEISYAVGGCHTMHTLVPESLFDEHPEYFPMNEAGERFHGPHTQRCLTNPDVLAMSIEKVRQEFRDNPNALIASVTQADTYPDKPNNCLCPACRAIDEEEGSPVGSFLRYVNAIADAVREEFPDRLIDTFAYRYTRTPPKITRPRDNVVVRLCSIECCFAHSLEKCPGAYDSPGIGRVDTPSFVDDVKKWAEISRVLHIWNYEVNFVYYLAPHANLHVMQDNFRFYKKHHVTGIYPQGASDVKGSDMGELKGYILAKLLWDTEFDVQKGIAEFVQAYCGAGAPWILDYIRELNEKPERDGYHMCCYERPTREFFSPEFMAFAEECFDKAEAVAENDEIRERIRYWRMSLRYIRLWLYADTFTEAALTAEYGSFFNDMKKYGILALFEGGTFEASMERMKQQILQQRA